MSDERKEKAPPGVDVAILGKPGLIVQHVHVHRVQDCEGNVFESPDAIDVALFFGSRLEH